MSDHALTDNALSFDEFRESLARAFDVDPESLQPETNFLEDLAFDSLRMLQLGVAFENLDVDMPDEMAWGIQTVGDAYAYYLSAAGEGVETEASADLTS
jgi:acyl carrier protein